MENNQVPYIVYEGAQSKNERTVKRLVIALVIAIALIFVSNMAWLYAWTGYDYLNTDMTTTQMYTQDGQGLNIIGNENEVGDGSDTGSDKAQKNPTADK